MRQRIDETLRDRGDPVQALVAVTPLVERADGSIGDLRTLAPGLGELWDTFRASIRLAEAIADRLAEMGGGTDDDALQPATGASGDMGGSLSDRSADPGEDWNPALPDD
jgi:hypothetical protein